MTLRSFPEGPWSPGLETRGLAWDEVVRNDDLDKLAFVAEDPRIDDDGLTFLVWAVNDTDAPLALAISGFGLQPTHLSSVKFTGPTYGPPAPPQSVQIRLPARSRVGFCRAFRLTSWAFDGTPFDFTWFLRDQSTTIAYGTIPNIVVAPSGPG